MDVTALSTWHTELTLNDRARISRKSLLSGWLRCSFCRVTSLKIACEVQICSLTFLIIFNNSGKSCFLQVSVSPSTSTTKKGKIYQDVTNNPYTQQWFLSAICKENCTFQKPYLISFRYQPDGQGSLLGKQCFKGSGTDTWNRWKAATQPSSSTAKYVSLSTIFLYVQCATFPIIPILSSV